MRINYNITGTQRKELVKVIADITGAKTEYMKMPTCNYQIDYFTVTKDGALEFDDMADSEEVEKVLDAIAAAGFEPEPQKTAEPEAEKTGLTVELPLDKAAVGTLTNILEAKETLIKKALGIDDLRFEIRDDKISFPWFEKCQHRTKAAPIRHSSPNSASSPRSSNGQARPKRWSPTRSTHSAASCSASDSSATNTSRNARYCSKTLKATPAGRTALPRKKLLEEPLRE